jgi:hypothetical protein
MRSCGPLTAGCNAPRPEGPLAYRQVGLKYPFTANQQLDTDALKPSRSNMDARTGRSKWRNRPCLLRSVVTDRARTRACEHGLFFLSPRTE